MSKMLKYTGTADSYELGAADFKKAGVEDARKVVFPRNEPVEVEDNVAEAILSEEGAFQGFSDVFEEAEDEEPRGDSNDTPKGSSDASEVTETGAKSTSAGTGTTKSGKTRSGGTTTRA